MVNYFDSSIWLCKIYACVSKANGAGKKKKRFAIKLANHFFSEIHPLIDKIPDGCIGASEPCGPIQQMRGKKDGYAVVGIDHNIGTGGAVPTKFS